MSSVSHFEAHGSHRCAGEESCDPCELCLSKLGGSLAGGEARLVSDPSGQSPWGCQGCIPPFVSLSPRLSGNSGEQEF